MKVVNLLLSTFLVLGLIGSVIGQNATTVPTTTSETQVSYASQNDLVASSSDAYLNDTESSFTILKDDVEKEIEFSSDYVKQVKGYKVGHSGVSVIVWPRLANQPGADPTKDYQILTVHSADNTTALSAIKTELHSAAQIELFPNPATEYVKVTFTESLTGKLYLHDVDGKLIKQIELTDAEKSYRFDLDDVEAGTDMLLLTFSGAGISWVKKLIIQRD